MFKIYIRTSLYFLVIISILTGISSCKTTKKIVRPELKPETFSTLYHKMEGHNVTFQKLSSKLAVNYIKQGKSDLAFKVNLRMQKDSILWASIVPGMGIEAARIEITPDSLKMINRLKKYYFKGKFSLLDSLLHTNINYSVLQSILLGNGLNQNLTFNSEKVILDGNYYKLVLVSKNVDNNKTIIYQKIWLNPDNFRIHKMDVLQQTPGQKPHRIEVFYDSHQIIDGMAFPQKVKLLIYSNPKTEIFITFKNINLNQSFGFPFYIPSKYKMKRL